MPLFSQSMNEIRQEWHFEPAKVNEFIAQSHMVTTFIVMTLLKFL